MTIPFFEFRDYPANILNEEEEALLMAYRSRNYILGDYKAMFEKAYAQYLDSRYCIGVSSGYDALLLALKATASQGTEVLLPVNTFRAVLLAVLNHDCIPVFADIDETGNMAIDQVETLLNERTSAVIGVHTHGNPLDGIAFRQLCENNGVAFIEDFSQAHGSRYKGRYCGTFGHVSVASLYPTKTLGAKGDAGVITTNSESNDKLIRSLQDYYVPGHNEPAGVNARLDEIQAALLLVRLKHLPVLIEERTRMADSLDRALENIPELSRVAVSGHALPAWYVYNVFTEDRPALKHHLALHHIHTLSHYEYGLDQLWESSYDKGRHYPMSTRFVKKCLSLPFFPGMGEDELGYVTKVLKDFYTK